MTARLARGLIGFFLLLVLALAASTSQQPDFLRSQEQQKQSDKAAPVPDSVLRLSDSDFQKSNSNQKLNRMIDKLSEPMLWVTIGILWVTWHGIKIALGTLKQIKRQTDATAIAAKAAEQAANVSEKALSVIERPYLYVSEMSAHDVLHVKKPYVIITFSNSGRTVAARVKFRIGIDFRHKVDGLLTITPQEFLTATQQGPYTVAPLGFIRIPFAFHGIMSDEMTAQWKKQALKFVVWGTIEYLDTLNNTVETRRYAARYIHWGIEPRIADIPDFWILNDLSNDGIAWQD